MTVFIVGGVMSGVGKGVVTASIGALLKECGLNVTAMKIDPYINVDAGTMNPTEHGEVFVTKDGMETDQDIGNYERFLNQDIPRVNYMTTGTVYSAVIERERSLGYGGKTVEAVPHIPLEIIDRIKKAQKVNDADITLVEIGGTLGEYQNVLFLEAARMMGRDNPSDVLTVLVSYMPVPATLGEMKTKPTQYAIKLLNESGMFPDLIVARSTHAIDDVRKAKLSRNCGLNPEDVIAAPDVDSIYKVPTEFKKQKVAQLILDKFKLKQRCPVKSKWTDFAKKIDKDGKPVKIGVVGKYFSTGDF
ncbi:CTP synthase, partial [Candidatus Uhrbacteria bacterium]|nr:CTP synthase [Candidatus Uhrbacteria bacterium]